MNVIELKNIIKEVSLTQAPVKSVYSGDVYDIWNSGEIKYGSLCFGLQSATYNSNLCTYTYIFYYADRLLQDKSNVNAVYTDGINAIQSVLNILNNAYNVEIPENVNYTPFEQKFMDYLAGVYATVEITTDSSIGLCSMDDYDYSKDDKDKLIEQLIEEIIKYKDEDKRLALLLQEILHKINGEIAIVE